jgi:hypothetical protein
VFSYSGNKIARKTLRLGICSAWEVGSLLNLPIVEDAI